MPLWSSWWYSWAGEPYSSWLLFSRLVERIRYGTRCTESFQVWVDFCPLQWRICDRSEPWAHHDPITSSLYLQKQDSWLHHSNERALWSLRTWKKSMNQLIKNNFQRRDPCHFGADPDTRIRNCPEAGTYLQADPDPQHWLFSLVQISVADPDPGLGTILTPGSGIRDGRNQHPDPGSGTNNPDHIF